MADAGAMEAPPGPSWVGEALDGGGRWWLRTRIPYILGLILLFDSWDSIAIAYTLPSIIADWKLSALEAGALISAGYGGQFLGAGIFGTLAERRGRMPVMRPLIIVMALLAIVCAICETYFQLIAVRLVQGVAIGGALPVAICYVNEVAPTATRGKYFGTFQFLFLAGFGLAAMSSAWIVPTFGWHVMFALGAIPLLFVPVLYFLPESPRWLAGQGRPAQAAAALEKLGSDLSEAPPEAFGEEALKPSARVPVSDLLAPGVRGRSVVAGSMWFLTSLVSFGLVTWVPSIYVAVFSIPIEKALTYNSIAAVSIFFLPIFLRQTIDWIGRRPPAIAGTALGGAALLGMIVAPADSWFLVIGLMIVGQVGISIGSMILWPYTAEVYETRIRAVALGTASSIARGASMLTPLVVGGILEATGSVTLVFLVFGLSSLIVALLWWRWTRETAGRELEA